MTGRVVIVTGADRGVGYETARYLAAEGGYDVVLACREQEKGQSAVQRIRRDNPSALVTFMQVAIYEQLIYLLRLPTFLVLKRLLVFC